ncbi:MAG: flagellar protein export ATPase FliI [Clostridia bacterium]|jgi:flagellum-specific ATP synthase|nr:flagellar protein export ATPase FliI [Clostridia bacterium]
MIKYKQLIEKVKKTKTLHYKGVVSEIIGLVIQANGPKAGIGEMVMIEQAQGYLPAEVVGFRENKTLLMPLGSMSGIAPGSKIIACGESLKAKVGPQIVGRVLTGLGEPMDEKGKLVWENEYPLEHESPHPLMRKKIEDALPLGVRAMDGLLTCGEGQRLGIFAGSGVGKSTLLGMIARNSQADVNVIALIGERGREVREFIENDLGEKGLERSVVVVATSDQPALVRIKGAFLATACAEYFRDRGAKVIMMMDSVTRFAMAQREIGLAVGEPPATKGYTPSVFALLPKLLERTGTSEKGSITGLYSVLVDADDVNEPISDAVRGILDGHIVLSRQLAALGQYPAIDVLNSISRVMINIVPPEHLAAANRYKEVLAVYREAKDLIDVGAYQRGSNGKIDLAISIIDRMHDFIKQGINEESKYPDTIKNLLEIYENISRDEMR